jgi:hypothetical protein
MSAAGLRREISRGRLASERIAGRQYTTLGDVARMRERCREARAPDCGSEELTAKRPNPSGSSETDSTEKALAAVQESVRKLKDSSPPTSPKSTRPHVNATVIPLRS